MRRIMQSYGVDVTYLGHIRSVLEIVNCAIQEDVNAIAINLLLRWANGVLKIHG